MSNFAYVILALILFRTSCQDFDLMWEDIEEKKGWRAVSNAAHIS